jgi:transcriptional regulator with XRE-family HTH domain
MARTRKPANIVGPQIRKRRSELDLTQEELATRCQLQGFDISRGTLSQIEAQIRCVADDELLAFARVLKVTTDSLFTAVNRSHNSVIQKQPRRPAR